MPPGEVIAKLLGVNRRFATFILTGLGVLAAAAIFLSYGVNIDDALIVAAYILVFAFVVTLLLAVVGDRRMRTVMGWLMVGTFALFIGGLFDATFQLSGRLPSTPCYLRILVEPPLVCENRFATTTVVIGATDTGLLRLPGSSPERVWRVQNRTEPDGTPIPPADPSATVYVQFGADVTRSQSIALTTALETLGWTVPDARRGGELVKRVPDRNEVRYFHPEDLASATALAHSFHAQFPGSPIYVRDFSRLFGFVPKGQLEVWVAEASGGIAG
jgi:hypothetical protein